MCRAIWILRLTGDWGFASFPVLFFTCEFPFFGFSLKWNAGSPRICRKLGHPFGAGGTSPLTCPGFGFRVGQRSSPSPPNLVVWFGLKVRGYIPLGQANEALGATFLRKGAEFQTPSKSRGALPIHMGPLVTRSRTSGSM